MLSDSLKTLRAKHGMSQADLAKKLSVTQQAVGRWEREQTAPDFAMLKKMADIFNVSTDYLLGVESPQSRPPESPLKRRGEGREYHHQANAWNLNR